MISLWILAILVVFALGLGHRAMINLRLARYQRDRLKATCLAKAGINAIISEKQKDISPLVDRFNESWSNKMSADENPVFQNYSLGDGTFTIRYAYKQSKSDNMETILYGMMDEQSKFNINNITDDTKRKQFVELLKLIITGIGQEETENLVNALADWIDADDISRLSGGSESNDYVGYSTANKPLSTIQELLLVKGFNQEILYGKDKNEDGTIDSTEEGIINYITIYGNDKININTTTQEVLQALINAESQLPEYSTLAKRIFDNLNRKGTDGILGTEDDGFVTAVTLDKLGLEADSPERSLIGSLINNQYLIFSSNIFRIKSTGIVNNARKEIETVVTLEVNKLPIFIYWHEN